MKNTHTVLLGIWLALVGINSAVFAEPAEPEAGKHLFEREWKVDDLLSPQGDGLGPMHNARSCAACHHQGGLGGGGGVDRNVDILSLPSNVRSADPRAAAIHPAFRRPNRDGVLPTNIVLHRFGKEAAYQAQREQLLRQEDLPIRDDPDRHPTRISYRPIRRLSFPTGIVMVHSQRNTPALFGAGLINRLPFAAIHQAERKQAAMNGPIRGVAPRVGRQIGRFGWRGQTVTLEDFVAMACANELGLASRQSPQPLDPLHSNQVKNPAQHIDMSDFQLRALTTFVAGLPAPTRLRPADPRQRQVVERGERLFGQIGCGVCHQQVMGEIDGLYSDMLLHDMGATLADTVAAYYGSTSVAGTSGKWRTPPLWGVADSAPYLHDGRAATLMEAIVLHGGEARQVRRLFLQLPLKDRLALIAFLQTLVAPSS